MVGIHHVVCFLAAMCSISHAEESDVGELMYFSSDAAVATPKASIMLGEQQGLNTADEDGPSGSWVAGSTVDKDFAFTFQGEAKLVVQSDGAVWGAHVSGDLNSAESAEINTGGLNKANELKSGSWSFVDTKNGGLALAYANEPKLLITKSGGVWGQAAGGFFVAREAHADQEAKEKDIPKDGKELKQGGSFTVGDWEIGETVKGDFAAFKGDTVLFFIHRDGDIWGGAANGWFATTEARPMSISKIESSISTVVVDCETSEWSDYGKCSKECGGGQQFRLRHIATQPTGNGAQCPELRETRPCATKGCPTDCVVEQWSPWSKCNVACGGGTSNRARMVFTYPSSQGQSCPQLQQDRDCNMQQCGVRLCTDGIAAAYMSDLDAGTGATFFTKTPIAGSEGHEDGGKWLRFDMDTKEIQTGPHMIREHPWFKKLPAPFDTNVDAAVNKADKPNEIYLFSEDMWLLWDKQIDRASRGPFRMREHELFEKLPEPFTRNITAAFNMKDESNEVMLFSQKEEGEGAMKTMISVYLTWNLAENTVVDGPFRVNDAAKPLNLPVQFNSRIDTALNRRAASSSVMLFSGSWWVDYDYSKNAVTHGPYLISQHPLFQPISTALELCSGYDLNRLGNLTEKVKALRPVPRGTVHWIAGTGAAGFADSDGLPAVPIPNKAPSSVVDARGQGGQKAMFNAPKGMVVVGGDTAYIADSSNNAIRRVDLASGNTTTIAGGGAAFAGFMDGLGTAARFNRPLGISAMRLKRMGDVLYVADADNNAVRRLSVPMSPPYDAITVTVTGGGTGRCDNCTVYPSTSRCTACCQCQTHGFQDGSGHDGKLYEPSGVALVYNGSATGATKNEFVYVTDKLNHAIRRIVVNPGGSIGDMVTVAGGSVTESDEDSQQSYVDEIVSGAPGFSDGIGAAAKFSQPSSIAALRHGDEDILYIADTGSNAVRRVSIVAGLAEEQEEEAAMSTLDASEEGDAANRKLLFSASRHAPLQAQSVQPKPLAYHVSISRIGDTGDTGNQTAVEAAIRFTAPGGSAAVDAQCAFPFIFEEEGFNDCATVESNKLGITSDKFDATNGWCRTTFEEDVPDGAAMEWGPCMPAGYMPDICVTSSWSSWSRCDAICGGSNTSRTRTVIHEGESQSECPHLVESQDCNVHPCADTRTIAGGYTLNGDKLGIGFTDIYNNPDVKYSPASISALRVDDIDVLFLSGNPAQSPRLRRIDIRPGDGSNCSSAMLDADPSAEIQGCRTVETKNGVLEATVAGVIGTPLLYSTTSLTTISEDELFVTSRNSLSRMDLRLQVPCASWVGTDMNTWIFEDDATSAEQSNPIQMMLNPEYGREGKWEFYGYRQRQMFNYAGEDKGFITKNTMCMKQLHPGVPPNQAQSACCTYKQAPILEEPDTSECNAQGINADPICLGLKADFESVSKSLLEEVKVL